MLQNTNFPGLHYGPRWGAYSAPPDPLADGEGLAAPPKIPCRIEQGTLDFLH